MNIDDLTIRQARELAAMFGGDDSSPQTGSAYKIGGLYMFRTVTHIITGRILRICRDGIVVTDAAWIADTGRYAQAVASGDFNEVEPYKDDVDVIINLGALIDSATIPKLPRDQK